MHSEEQYTHFFYHELKLLQGEEKRASAIFVPREQSYQLHILTNNSQPHITINCETNCPIFNDFGIRFHMDVKT